MFNKFDCIFISCHKSGPGQLPTNLLSPLKFLMYWSTVSKISAFIKSFVKCRALLYYHMISLEILGDISTSLESI